MSRRDDAPDFQEIARRLREKQPERLKPARERRNPTRDWVTDHELRQDVEEPDAPAEKKSHGQG